VIFVGIIAMIAFYGIGVGDNLMGN
jgi:hypothetical protein